MLGENWRVEAMERKRVLLLVVVASLLLVALRELGVLNLNYYKSEVATDRVGISGLITPPGAGSSLSYDLIIFYDGEYVSSSSHQIGGAPRLEIEVDVIPEVSGNYWAPLYKSFTIEFSTFYESATLDSQYVLSGDVTGTTQVTVIGLCTRHKALELARDEVVEVIRAYFEGQLGSGW